MANSDKAKSIYQNDLKATLEADHFGQFVAIEPESEESFVADTFVAAALAAKEKHPSKTPFVIRIGHEAALHIGGATV